MTISLSKGQRVSLLKREGGTLTRAHMGLGWDAKTVRGFFGREKEQEIDLDASCLVYDGSGLLIDQVWFQQLVSVDGSIRHTGDNTTGAGDGDDESIVVDLLGVDARAQTLVFVVNSYSGENFSQIENAFCRLVDATNGVEIARYALSGSGSHTAQIMAKLVRDGSGWSMQAIGERAQGRTIRDLLPAVARIL
ncbi:TerD family protein [Rathayibacter sp. VKM Ac-2760]|uniref:TerD family protein n=1 Tax=Rathayibacter sp. VKM Ac-2760 TaxID=2609253 RepID=UPI001318FB4E|nr:TerD family protein [Rathayibacter sp. VKM Ac-2760]QHC57202.1 TerD family protein [Rathayibacter sp. VKM Ac-2760]